jgi:exosome complex RNA-binding protein Rrp4
MNKLKELILTLFGGLFVKKVTMVKHLNRDWKVLNIYYYNNKCESFITDNGSIWFNAATNKRCDSFESQELSDYYNRLISESVVYTEE